MIQTIYQINAQATETVDHGRANLMKNADFLKIIKSGYWMTKELNEAENRAKGHAKVVEG